MWNTRDWVPYSELSVCPKFPDSSFKVLSSCPTSASRILEEGSVSFHWLEKY